MNFIRSFSHTHGFFFFSLRNFLILINFPSPPFSFSFSFYRYLHLPDDGVISGTPCTCEKHGRPETECPVGSSCWDSGSYDNSGCKTEAAPSKCSTATCTAGKTTKTGYCPNGDCSEANCCEYPACTSDGVISGTPCTCEKHGRPKTECPVGSSCWDSGSYDNSGCKAEAAPSARCDTMTTQCSNAGKSTASYYCDQGGCTEASCCENPGCNADGVTAAVQECQCGAEVQLECGASALRLRCK